MSEPFARLDDLFHPRSVAIAGISSGTQNRGAPGGGGNFLESIREMGFDGPLYPVNPKAQEIAGLPCYPSLRDIPGPVDYLISSVPAPAVPQLVEDAIAKGVRLIHFFTAGFSETGDDERSQLEQQVMTRLREAGIRVLGPNCMGLYVPTARLSFMQGAPLEPGGTALVSQSGANANDFVRQASERGVRFSTVVSYGNAADLNESDLLAHAAADPATTAIFAYIEGVRSGRRFVEVLRQAARNKPVVILKGGRTSAGARAAASHTGSLAGSLQVFDALCRQMGALRVESLEELVDLAVAFRFLTPPAGRGVAVVGAGGGTSVLAADMIDAAGLEVPPLPAEVQEGLRRFTPVAGTSIRNPLDLMSMFQPEQFATTLQLAAQPDSIHAVLFHTNFGWGRRDDTHVDNLIRSLVQGREAISKPLVVAVRPSLTGPGTEQTAAFVEACAREGIALFPGIDRAARALARLVDWRDRQQKIAG
ncbi:MAG: acetate--CoA ligase family protein [Dehalococcoidia bacterium]